jgi:hypothetical protein
MLPQGAKTAGGWLPMRFPHETEFDMSRDALDEPMAHPFVLNTGLSLGDPPTWTGPVLLRRAGLPACQ